MQFSWWMIGWLLLAILSCRVIYADILTRTISNKLCLSMLCVSLLIGFSQLALFNIVIGCLVLLALYGFSIWGGGDSKLAIAFLPAISEQYFCWYLLFIAFLGGVLALIYLIYGCFVGIERVKQNGLPYGIPICLSGLFFIAASI